MEGLLVILGLALVAMPVAVIYLLVSNSGLKTRLAQLETDVAGLVAGRGANAAPDTAAQNTPPDAPEPDTAVATPVEPMPEQQAAAEVVAAREQAHPETPAEPAGPSVASRLLAWLVVNWFYVVSALSLALAGLYLVQYGVENGLLPPTARVLAALLFGAVLIAAGEVIRRRFGDGVEASTAYLPSVFSGAGLVSLFGGVVAARLLYGLISPEVALGGMAIVGGLGMFLGWMHGPLLAAVGVIGAFAAPLFVGSDVPATPLLFVYFAVIATVGLGIDTLRRWAWVSILSLVLAYGMGALTWIGATGLAPAFALYLVALVVMAVLIPARGLWPDHEGAGVVRWAVQPQGGAPGFATVLAAGAVAVTSLGLCAVSVIGTDAFWVTLVALGGLGLVLVLWSVRALALQDLAILPVIAALVATAVEGTGNGPVIRAFSVAYATNPEADFPLAVTILWAIGLALSIAAALRALRLGEGLAWALGAALVAPAMAIILEVTWQPAAVIGAYPWALHAIAMASVMVGLALRTARHDGQDMLRASLFVLSALAAITFALVLILSLSALTVALAVTVTVAAALDRQFKLPLMQVFVAAGVVGVGARLVADPGLTWAMDAPIWELVLAYGGSLAAFCAALWVLRGMARKTAQVMLDTAAWSTGGLFASLLLYRALEAWIGGDGSASHWALGLYAVIWLGLMVTQLLRKQELDGPLNRLRLVLAAVFGAIGIWALGLAVTAFSPLLTDWGGAVSGPAILNTLLVAYLLPALVLALGAWRLRHRLLRIGLGAAALALAVYWFFAALRHLWQGPSGMQLSGGFSQPELYSYTVAILVAGAALFYQSLASGSVVLRRAGLVVIGLAVAKVFLIDISGLDGLTRVLSLVVLGVSLAALAWLNRWAQNRTASD